MITRENELEIESNEIGEVKRMNKKLKEFFESLPKIEVLKMTSLSEFEEPFSLMFELYMAKNKGYGASWRKRGIPSSFENISRKYDRLLVQVEKSNFHPENLSNEEKLDFFDTAIDIPVFFDRARMLIKTL